MSNAELKGTRIIRRKIADSCIRATISLRLPSSGELIFIIQFGHSTEGPTLLWTGLNLSLIYLFIFEPVQELKRRKVRYYESSFSKRQRPWRGIKPGAAFGCAFFASLVVTLVEFTITLFKGGLIFAVKWLIALPILTQVVLDHLDHKSASPNYIQPIMVPTNQVHLATTLYFV